MEDDQENSTSYLLERNHYWGQLAIAKEALREIAAGTLKTGSASAEHLRAVAQKTLLRLDGVG